MSIFKKFWDRVATPKRKTVLYAIAYFILLLVGAYSLYQQPNSLEYAIGSLAMYMLSGLLVLGGILGVPTALFGEWKLERVATVCVGLAAIIYFLLIMAIQWEEPDGNRFLQAGFVACVILMTLERYSYIRRRPEAPEEEKVFDNQP